MPKRAVDVYWHGSRVGSAGEINWYGFKLSSVTVDPDYAISRVVSLPLAFDPNFAELRGITGVELE